MWRRRWQERWHKGRSLADDEMRRGRGGGGRGDLCARLARYPENFPHAGSRFSPPATRFSRPEPCRVPGDQAARIALKVPMTSIRLPLLISRGEVRTLTVEESCHNPQLAALTGGRRRTDNRPHNPIGFQMAGLFRVRKSDLCLGVTKAAAEAPGGNAADRAAARALGVPAAHRATVPHPISKISSAAARIV